ncbi:MAG: asparagine synthase (glutamine-hydrolyzing) [Nitrospirae bacterium]|nr:asparagine synthase (glutamine-hydrolyzing) [Nitrospirota bacterium]
MCGISGFLEPSRRSGNRELQRTVLKMVNTLHHRGPDDGGAWVDAETGIALGHRRLSIVDISPEGHQPMRSACGRFVISFNGEVYNFKELRRELEDLGYAFRGHSDTEIMLSSISHWGVVPSLSRFNGMFAFALWDRQERELHLVRDRLGEKPLYYGWIGKAWVFGSELKALRAHPDFHGEINRDALTLYFRHNNIPAPYSIYKDISKVLPGTIVTLARTDGGYSPRVTRYWSARSAAERGLTEPFAGSQTEALDCLDGLLRDTVKHRMISDVPLGAFLSGGIDSSTIVALMQAQSEKPVQTFTIGFHEAEYNEATQAKAVARHLGTAHTELYVTPEETMAVIPKLPSLYDEPFADVSQIPTFLVSELACRNVTVALSGDGGDELFGGYERYIRGLAIWNKVGWMPAWASTILARCLRTLSVQSWDNVFRIFDLVAPKVLGHRSPGDKLHKLAEVILRGGPPGIYLHLASHWAKPSSLVLGGSEPLTVVTDPSHRIERLQFQEHMMYWDMVSYLPDDILVKVDRASMGVSLESRVPFLDHRIVEFAWQIPLEMKIRNGRGKWLLRQLLYKYVPPALIDRPKMGFGVPIETWLRGPLREWAEDLLTGKKLEDQGFLDANPIRERWNQHISGTRNWEYELWDVLMFQAWLGREQQYV